MIDDERAKFLKAARAGEFIATRTTFFSTFENLTERITNLEAITQALADELTMKDGQLKFLLGKRNSLADQLSGQSDFLDSVIAEYRHALDTLESYEGRMGYCEYGDWRQTQEDARNAGNP